MQPTFARHTRAVLLAAGLFVCFGAANVAEAACTVTYQNGGVIRQCNEQTQVGPGTQSGGNYVGGLPVGGSVGSAPSMPSFDLSQLDSLLRTPQSQASAPAVPSVPQSAPSFSMPSFDFSSFGNMSSLFSYLR